MVSMKSIGLGGGMVIVFVAVVLLGMFPAVDGPLGISMFYWSLIVAGSYLVGIGVVLRKASGGAKRWAKFGAMGAAAFFLASGFIFPALMVVPPGPGLGAPTAVLTIAEGSVYDFPDFATDGNGATGLAEIAVNSDDLSVTLDLTGESDPGTLSPDSFAVDFTLRCTGGCDYEMNGAAFQTPYHASVVGLSDWVIAGNTSDIEIYEKNADGTWQIAWEDTGSSAIVGFTEGGAMNSFGDGESGTFTFSMYLNENGIPDGVPDAGQKYTRSATVNIFSPRGGTSFNVVINLTLTVNT